MSEHTVLVLSDELEIAKVWSHACSLRGIDVDTAELSWVSAELADDARYSLCAIDVNHEGADLSDLCRAIRAVFRNPILVFTYEQDERYQRGLYAARVDEVIIKPVGVQLLLAKVQAWLARTSIVTR